MHSYKQIKKHFVVKLSVTHPITIYFYQKCTFTILTWCQLGQLSFLYVLSCGNMRKSVICTFCNNTSNIFNYHHMFVICNLIWPPKQEVFIFFLVGNNEDTHIFTLEVKSLSCLISVIRIFYFFSKL